MHTKFLDEVYYDTENDEDDMCTLREVKVCKNAMYHPFGVCTKNSGVIHVKTTKENLQVCLRKQCHNKHVSNNN